MIRVWVEKITNVDDVKAYPEINKRERKKGVDGLLKTCQ